MDKLHVKITQECIDYARRLPRLPDTNPVSVALTEDSGSFWVAHQQTITDTEIGATYKLPVEAQKFIADFNAGIDVKPVEFDLEFVDQNFYAQFMPKARQPQSLNTPAPLPFTPKGQP